MKNAKYGEVNTSLTGSVRGDQALWHELERRRFSSLHGNNRCDGKYADYLRYYLGEESWLPPGEDADWESDTGLSILPHAVDQQVSAELDMGFVPEIEPMETSDLLKARILEFLITPRWQSPEFLATRASMTKMRIMSGTAAPMVLWNKNIGDIDVHLQDPRTVYCTPKAQTENEVTEYFREAWMDVGEIASRWPDAPPIAPDSSDGELGLFRESDEGPPRRATVIHCDIRFDSDIMDKVKAEGGGGYSRFDVEGWKRVSYCRGAILEIRKISRKRPAQILIPNYIIPNSMFGMSDFRNTWKLQRECCRILNAYHTSFYLTGNPILAISGMATTEIGKLLSRPGMVIPLGSKVADVSKAIMYLQTPSVPSYGLDLLRFNIETIYRIMGTPDATQGIRPAGVVAGRAIEKLQAAAGMLPAQKVYNSYLGHLKILRDEIDLVTKYYSDEQVIRLTGEMGMETLSALNQQGMIRSGMGEIMRQNGEKGERFQAVAKLNFRELFKNAVDFDIRLKLGHPLIENRQQKENKALTWVKLGAMDPSVAMKYSGFDDATIAENEAAMKRKAEAEAELKTQVLQAKNGGNGGPTQDGENGDGLPPRNYAKEVFEAAMGRS